MRNRQFFLFMTFALSASLLGACNISGNVTIQPVTDMPGTAVPVTTEIVSPAVAGAASTVSPPTSTPDAITNTVCWNYTNVRSAPATSTYYWRFFISFKNMSYVKGCFEVVRADDPTISWHTMVNCTRENFEGVKRSEMDTPYEAPAQSAATEPLYFITLQPKSYYSCDFNLNQLLNAALTARPDLGSLSTIADAYTYSYFSISALGILSPNQIYSGTLLTIEPDSACPENSDIGVACKKSTWSLVSEKTNTVSYVSSFNESPPFISPVPFTYTPDLLQAWWVGSVAQYDTLRKETVIRQEQHHDQAFVQDKDLGLFRHQATVFGRKSAFVDGQPDQRVRFWGGLNHIIFGLPPGMTGASFNGGIVQIGFDPGGAGSPDSAT